MVGVIVCGSVCQLLTSETFKGFGEGYSHSIWHRDISSSIDYLRAGCRLASIWEMSVVGSLHTKLVQT